MFLIHNLSAKRFALVIRYQLVGSNVFDSINECIHLKKLAWFIFLSAVLSDVNYCLGKDKYSSTFTLNVMAAHSSAPHNKGREGKLRNMTSCQI